MQDASSVEVVKERSVAVVATMSPGYEESRRRQLRRKPDDKKLDTNIKYKDRSSVGDRYASSKRY